MQPDFGKLSLPQPLMRSVMWQPRIRSMSKIHYLSFAVLIACLPVSSSASSDARMLVELPQMMREHMMTNMRDHLAAVNEILIYLGSGELDKAAETAEFRLGMSSLESHGASHMAKFMPEGMRQAGTTMHKAASRFALKAQEGEALPAYQALSDITSACVACHSGYRVK
jgi:cytochrome c556